MANITYNPNEINVNTTTNEIKVDTTTNEINVTTQVNEIAVHTDPIIIQGEVTPPEEYNKVYVSDTVPGTTKEGDQWYSTLTGRIETRANGEWKPVVLDGQNF